MCPCCQLLGLIHCQLHHRLDFLVFFGYQLFLCNQRNKPLAILASILLTLISRITHTPAPAFWPSFGLFAPSTTSGFAFTVVSVGTVVSVAIWVVVVFCP